MYDEWTAKTGDPSFASFLRVPFRNFFVSQSHYRKYGTWPFDERDHGLPGMLQSFSELLGCAADVSTVGCQLDFLTREWPKGHWVCPCGSGASLRRCCRPRFNELSKRIDRGIAARLFNNLKALLILTGEKVTAASVGYRHH